QAIVEIALRDGRKLSHRMVAVRGTADNPMTRAEVEAKALDLMADLLGRACAEDLIAACRNLYTVKDLCELRRHWQPPAPRAHFSSPADRPASRPTTALRVWPVNEG